MMNLIFIGTGVSCALPVIGHLQNGDKCACHDALHTPNSRNRRNNVSLLVEFPKYSEPPQRPINQETVVAVAPPTAAPPDVLIDGAGRSVVAENEVSASTTQRLMAQSGVFRTDQAYVLIDCGKTFRDAYFRYLAPRGIRYVDALFLTHGHADAMQCVEEVCRLHTETRRLLYTQHLLRQVHVPTCLDHITTYMTEPTRREVADVAPEVMAHSQVFNGLPKNKESLGSLPFVQCLGRNRPFQLPEEPTQCNPVSSSLIDSGPMPPPPCESEPAPSPPLLVTSAEGLPPVGLRCYCMDEVVPHPLYVPALGPSMPVYSLPVEHGKDYVSLGFVFGTGTAFKSTGASRQSVAGKSCVVYISDVSGIPDLSMRFLLDLAKIDVLVFDLLAEKGRSSPPHTCWDDVMPYIRVLAPQKTYCVGMFCSLEHEASNQLWLEDLAVEKARVRAVIAAVEDPILRAQDEAFLSVVKTVELAYDGMELQLPV